MIYGSSDKYQKTVNDKNVIVIIIAMTIKIKINKYDDNMKYHNDDDVVEDDVEDEYRKYR